MANEKKTDWKEKELGALWLREGKNTKFLSGFIKDPETGEKQQVIVFKNKKDENTHEKAPDYSIFKNDFNDEKKPSEKKSAPAKEESVPDVDEDEVPF